MKSSPWRAIAAALAASLAVAGSAASQAQAGSATELNRRVVARFADLLYRRHDVKAAFDTCVAKCYIQHSPSIADGREAAVATLGPMFARPGFKIAVRRILVDGDYAAVLLHTGVEGGTAGAIVDLFRLQDGKIVEHWDVNQPIPTHTLNPHPLF